MMLRHQIMLIIFFTICVFFISCEQAQQMLEPATQVDPSTPILSNAVNIPGGMVFIPAGEFQMGSDDNEADFSEQPIHTVYVDAFYMDTHEVTNAAYKKFIDANSEWQKDTIDENYHEGELLITLDWK